MKLLTRIKIAWYILWNRTDKVCMIHKKKVDTFPAPPKDIPISKAEIYDQMISKLKKPKEPRRFDEYGNR